MRAFRGEQSGNATLHLTATRDAVMQLGRRVQDVGCKLSVEK
jgi:hypothetical protein